MTQQEFTELTKVKVSEDEFEAINVVYNYSDLEKKPFCRLWCAMNKTRVEEYKAREKMLKEQERIWAIVEKFEVKGYEWLNTHYAGEILRQTELDSILKTGFNPYNKRMSVVIAELRKLYFHNYFIK